MHFVTALFKKTRLPLPCQKPQPNETKIQIPSQGHRDTACGTRALPISPLPSTLTPLQPPRPPLFWFLSQASCPGCSLVLAHCSSLCGIAGSSKATFLSSHGHHPTTLGVGCSHPFITNCDARCSPRDHGFCEGPGLSSQYTHRPAQNWKWRY